MTDSAPSAAITAERLQRLAPRCDYVEIAPYLARAAAGAEIDTPRRVRHFLAQVFVETGGLVRLTESLDYSAERLCAVWPARFPTIEAAQPFAHKPQALAEKVYGGRLGNTRPGDGWRYIGRGGLMRTGRDGYQAAQVGFALAGVLVDLLNMPATLATNAYAWADAANVWRARDLNTLADADDLEAITRVINGGLTGLADRQAALTRAATIWGD